MTNPTPHGQVPEALIDLIDAYAETRHRYGGIYNARTEAARKAVIEALSGVQALSAAPAGWKLVPVNPTPEMWKAAKSVPDPNPPYPPHYGLVWDAMLAASPTPPAEQQAAPKAAPGEPDGFGSAEHWKEKAQYWAGVAHRLRGEALRGEPVDGIVHPPAPQQEPATAPRFNCWSTNEGDSWFDHPADAQAIYDCLGNDAKVGDEYELTAGWKSVTARYRITEVVGDGEEYEVECVSHPHENSAPQPAPNLPERDASLPAERQGLFRKFVVGRVDGSDKPGGKHYGCTYFVLDVDHDPCARPALAAYAAACESTHPTLAADLRTKWGVVPAPQPSPTAPATQQPEGDVVAYLDVGAGGYLDLEAALSDEAMQQLPKGRHALVITGTYGINGYVAAPQPSPTAQSADSVQEDAARYRWLREGNDAKHGAAWHVAVNLYGCEWDSAIDAAIAAQGGK